MSSIQVLIYKKDFSQIRELEFGMHVIPMELRENSKHNFREKMHDKLLQMLDEYIDISVILKQFGKPKN
jgi:hypothetical protein